MLTDTAIDASGVLNRASRSNKNARGGIARAVTDAEKLCWREKHQKAAIVAWRKLDFTGGEWRVFPVALRSKIDVFFLSAPNGCVYWKDVSCQLSHLQPVKLMHPLVARLYPRDALKARESYRAVSPEEMCKGQPGTP